ncbi:cupin domain-containing protein [Nodosilinea sp. LEGE 07088]|uniref:cupin domain-containing protein n=1 Tax=Nodosilinea sp. LEGE 07088 TaxID=2777968 RepID=UPI0018826245|nr:cupin domain-containing protein [Nodosilinea sp. LEGE 07088]MBE9138671.1 cupin domain-containing protein [Nodosilinea sp. LEGE 07088]
MIVQHWQPTDLIEHPEGGRFREVFRSNARVATSDGDSRAALTHIYFSLHQGEVSRFHRVTSDEVWNLYQGEGLRLYTWTGTNTPPTCIELSPQANCFCYVIPAGTWQAAEPIGATVLVGCSVGPGFEFQDFEMIDPDSDAARSLRAANPTLSKFIVSA